MRAAAMPVERQVSFLDRLRDCQLLQPAQLDELASLPQAQESDPRALAKVVLQRGWLTRFQLNLVNQGKAAELKVGPYLLLDRLGEGAWARCTRPTMSTWIAQWP